MTLMSNMTLTSKNTASLPAPPASSPPVTDSGTTSFIHKSGSDKVPVKPLKSSALKRFLAKARRSMSKPLPDANHTLPEPMQARIETTATKPVKQVDSAHTAPYKEVERPPPLPLAHNDKVNWSSSPSGYQYATTTLNKVARDNNAKERKQTTRKDEGEVIGQPIGPKGYAGGYEGGPSGGAGGDGGDGGGDGGGDDGGDGGDCGGCFSGDNLIRLASGHEKPIWALRKGDCVLCDPEGDTATVVCMITTPIPNGTSKMVRFANGLDITPTHPIFDTVKGWVFPRDLCIPGGVVEQVECNAVFDILLDSHHTVMVNGTMCAALGHNRDGYTKHEFWGDWETVTCWLKSIDAVGFEMGAVEVIKKLRDQETGRVYGLEGKDGKVRSSKE